MKTYLARLQEMPSNPELVCGSFINVLLIGASSTDSLLVREILKGSVNPGYRMAAVTSVSAGLAHLSGSRVDAVLLALGHGQAGLAAITALCGASPSVPVVVLSHNTDEQVAVQAVQAGAQDYLLTSDATLPALTRSIRYSIERKRADEAFHKSDERLRLTLEATSEGVLEWDIPSGRSFLSPGCSRMLGYPPNAFVGDEHAWKRLIHPEDLGLIEAAQRAPDDRRHGFSFEMRMRSRSGEWCWVWSRGMVVQRDRNGQAMRVVSTCTDISERKRAERQLAETRANFGSLIESTNDLIWSVDLDLKLLILNRAFGARIESAFGFPVRVGMNPEEIWSRSKAALLRNWYRQALTGGPFRTEYALFEGCTLELAFSPVEQDGCKSGVSVFAKDVTHRKWAEEITHRYQFLSRHSSDIFLFFRREDGRILEANAAAEKAYGYTRSELLGLSARALRADRPTSGLHADQPDPTNLLFEAIHRRKDGSTFPVEVSSQSVTSGPDGTVVRVIRDITERKKAEAALRESEERLRLAMSAANEAIWEYDPESGATRCNDTYTTNFGRNSEAGSSLNWWTSHVHPKDRARVLTSFLQAIDGKGASWLGEYRFLRSDGRWADVYDRAVIARDGAGNATRVVGAMLDVTVQKRAERLLDLSNRRLRQLSRDLLRSQDYERRRIARELHDSTSQLLAALSMNLSRLRDPALHSDRKRQALEEALELASACSIEIRTVTFLLHPPLLDEVGLESALHSYTQGFYQRTGIRIDIIIAPGFGRLSQPLEVTFFRIVQEGLANIHRHSGSPEASIRLERTDAEARLTIQDRGRGFPAQTPPSRGFVRFGVGIMGMRERAEQLGGCLELASSAAGTRLTVTLPVMEDQDELANSLS